MQEVSAGESAEASAMTSPVTVGHNKAGKNASKPSPAVVVISISASGDKYMEFLHQFSENAGNQTESPGKGNKAPRFFSNN